MTMASKKTAATQPDDLLAQLDDLGAKATSTQPRSKPSTRPPKQNTSSHSEQDLLAELGSLATRPASRPATPSLRPSGVPAGARSPKRSSTATPPPGRSSEDKSNNSQRKSGESDSARSTQNQTFTPATTSTDESPGEVDRESVSTPQAKSTGGGWWSGILSTATAAVSQAQAAVKEIQKNEEAQRWTEQMRGNVGALRGFGGDLRSMALPTFQNILQTIAPPISSHERLQIHITHDLSGYPTLDPVIYQVFSRVMAQVEGGDLMVVQKGQEAAPRRGSESGKSNRPIGSWHDGPWWRSGDRRSINAVKGAVEGSKLVRASAEGYATEFFASKGGVEEAAKQATETLSESNPTRNSEIFLAIQAISQNVAKGLFLDASGEERDEEGDEIVFALYLHDPIHGIAFYTMSQAIPSQWVEWLDASPEGSDALPESIQEIIESGGVDPREWVSEWIEEVLSLGVGVVAQKYVAKRMGVGEGGVGKGKMRAERPTAEMVESGGGEAARALGGM